ncbi:PP2C family protein-serine/threonine phosphatase [uncultured Pseudokineococcus sp.]|uniref:PP2C family protein-serine/threonine phosphatase n=1 Tax=uncultured Pseudokineococcus sp. TaxID=1642928 RepID=UPI00260EF09F|nr:GAF domain-containing SpoIIE family protein phosphatase [uncultured Pseudokineococcus sp.]
MTRTQVLPAPAPPVLRPPVHDGELPESCPLPALPDPAFDRFARLARTGLGVPLSLVSLVSQDGQVVPGAAGLPEEQAHVRRHDLRHSVCQTVVRAGRTVAHADVRVVPELDGVPAPGLGLVAYLGAPLRDASGRPVGALCAIDTRVHPWSADEVELLEELATAASSELALRQLLQERRSVVATLQEGMVDRVPSPPGLEVRVRSVPGLDGERVGGDWYDVVVGGDEVAGRFGRVGCLPALTAPCAGPRGAGPEGLVLVLGDVMGHDARASAVMGQLRAMTRTTAWSFPAEGPADVLGRVDRAMAGLGVTSMATCVVARVEEGERGGRRLRWTSAGHPPPVVVLPDGTAEVLPQRPGVPLGVMPEVQRVDSVVDLPAGSVALLYSDGLVERRGRCITESLHLLAEAAGRWAGRPLAELVDGVVREMLGDVGVDDTRDDVALLAVRVLP